MDAKEFILKLKKEMELLTKNEEELVETSRKLGDVDDDRYNNGDVTFVFNCAAYQVVRNEWDNKRKELTIVAECPVGRGAYSDILIKKEVKKGQETVSFLRIEHENFPVARLKNENKTRIQHAIEKLATEPAEYSLFITYYGGSYTESNLIKDVKSIFAQAKLKNSKDFKLFLLCSDWDILKYKFKEIK